MIDCLAVLFEKERQDLKKASWLIFSYLFELKAKKNLPK
jgi:hypothetical protein